MKVVKKFGLALYVTFEGSEKAINTFTAIHGVISSRGYGIELPVEGETAEYSVPGKGKVSLHRVDQENCNVSFVYGPFISRIVHAFGKS